MGQQEAAQAHRGATGSWWRRVLLPPLLAAALPIAVLGGCSMEAQDNAAATEPAPGVEAPADPAELVFCQVVGTRTTAGDCSYFEQLDSAAARGIGAFNVPPTMERGTPVTLVMSLSFASEALVDRYADAAAEAGPDSAVDAAAVDAEAQAPPPVAEPVPDEPGVSARPSEPMASIRPPRQAAGMQPRPLPGPAETVAGGAGETRPFVPIVGRQMRATLTGRDFAVKALTPELQEVPLEGETLWQWEVTPQHRAAGAAELVLTTAVVAIAPDGTERVLKRTVKAQPIQVEVSLMGRVEDVLKATPTWLGYLAAIGTALGALLAAWKWLPGLRRKSAGEGE